MSQVQDNKSKKPRANCVKSSSTVQEASEIAEKLNGILSDNPQGDDSKNFKRWSYYGHVCLKVTRCGETMSIGVPDFCKVLVQLGSAVKFAVYCQHISNYHVYFYCTVLFRSDHKLRHDSLDNILHNMYLSVLSSTMPHVKVELVKTSGDLGQVPFLPFFTLVETRRSYWPAVTQLPGQHPLFAALYDEKYIVKGDTTAFGVGALTFNEELQFIPFCDSFKLLLVNVDKFRNWYKQSVFLCLSSHYMVLVDKELRGWSIPQLHMDNYLEFDEVQLGVAPGKGTQPVPKGVLKKKFAIHQAEFNADLWISTNFDFAFQNSAQVDNRLCSKNNYFFKVFCTFDQVMRQMKEEFLNCSGYVDLKKHIVTYDASQCNVICQTYNLPQISQQRKNLSTTLPQLQTIMSEKPIALHMLPVDQFAVMCHQALWLYSFIFGVSIPKHTGLGMIVFGESGTGKSFLTQALTSFLGAKSLVPKSDFQASSLTKAAMFVLPEWTFEKGFIDGARLSQLKMYFDLEYDVMVNVKNQDPSPIGKDVPAIMTTNDDWLQLLKKLSIVDRNALTRRILFLTPTSTFESLALPTRTTGVTDKLQQSAQLLVTLFLLGHLLYKSSGQPLAFTKISDNLDASRDKTQIELLYDSIEKRLETVTEPLLLALAGGEQEYIRSLYNLLVEQGGVPVNQFTTLQEYLASQGYKDFLLTVESSVTYIVSNYFQSINYDMQWNKIQADRCRKTQVSKIVLDNVIQYVISYAATQRNLVSLTQIRLAVGTYMSSNQIKLEKEWVEWIVISLFNDFTAHRMVSLPDKLEEQHYGQYMTQQQSLHYDDFSDIPLGQDYYDSAQKNAAFAKKQKQQEEINQQFAPKQRSRKQDKHLRSAFEGSDSEQSITSQVVGAVPNTSSKKLTSKKSISDKSVQFVDIADLMPSSSGSKRQKRN